MTDAKGPAIGVIGEQVVRNLENLRAARGYSFRDLAARVAKIGRPILPSAVHSITQHKRRVDVDDLVALAMALNVNPSALLLPRDITDGSEVDLTPTVRQRATVAWAWMDGQMPLPAEQVDGAVRTYQTAPLDLVDFVAHARPGGGAIELAPVIQKSLELHTMLRLLLASPGDRASFEARAATINRAYKALGLEIEQLLADSERAARESSRAGARP
jgi:transcriptional regulator with XRE-family HTH domain